VKYFARLREQVGRGEDEIAYEPGMSTEQVWQRATAGQAMPPAMLVAVNMDYVRGPVALKDGDEVAFFPPVTGG